MQILDEKLKWPLNNFLFQNEIVNRYKRVILFHTLVREDFRTTHHFICGTLEV
jgi:ATP-dependent Clp protease ATP-binding subunit ClpA